MICRADLDLWVTIMLVIKSNNSCSDPGIFVRWGGGGGGGPGQTDEKSSDNAFYFILVLIIFYRSQMVNFNEIYHFSRLERGSNIFQGGGGSNFFQGGGVQLLIPYRNPYNLWFSRGGGVRIPSPPPLDPHLNNNNSVHKICYLMHEIVRTAKSYRLNIPYGCISKYIFQGAPLIFVDLAEFFGVKIV